MACDEDLAQHLRELLSEEPMLGETRDERDQSRKSDPIPFFVFLIKRPCRFGSRPAPHSACRSSHRRYSHR